MLTVFEVKSYVYFFLKYPNSLTHTGNIEIPNMREKERWVSSEAGGMRKREKKDTQRLGRLAAFYVPVPRRHITEIQVLKPSVDTAWICTPWSHSLRGRKEVGTGRLRAPSTVKLLSQELAYFKIPLLYHLRKIRSFCFTINSYFFIAQQCMSGV